MLYNLCYFDMLLCYITIVHGKLYKFCNVHNLFNGQSGLYSNASAFALASANAAFAFALAFECPEVGAFAFALAFES